MSEIKSTTTAADVNAANKLNEKYRDKEAHETRETTLFSGVLVATLHILSGGAAIYAFWNFPMDGFAKTAFLAVLGVIVALIEIQKSKYMERFFILTLKGTDSEKYTLEQMTNYLNKSIVEKTKTAVFWGVSFIILVVGFSKSSINSTVIDYDTTVKSAYEQSVATLKNLTDRNAKAAILKDAALQVQINAKAWEREKSKGEGRNYDAILYAILEALLFAACIETAVFYARKFHEREQYKIQTSFENSQINATKKSVNSEGVKSVATNKKVDYEVIARKQAVIIKELQDFKNRENLRFTSLKNEVKIEQKDIETHNGAGKN